MRLQEIKLLHAYNAWANNRFFDALATLPTEQYVQDMKSSHGGIHGTLTHIVGAEKIWLSRWLANPDAMILKAVDVGSLAELRSIWEKVGYDMAKFLGTMSDKKLQETFSMKTSKGTTLTHVYWQAIQHMVNHSSYHRGQITTMLRQLQVDPPSTDLIRFYRETGKLK
jgi:uncharacterized damage-inducible protein DinB